MNAPVPSERSSARPTRGLPLTHRQLQVLQFIEHHIESRGYPPTIREIGNAMSIGSNNGVVDHLKALVRKGFLSRDAISTRAMRVLVPSSEAAVKSPDYPAATSCPHCGREIL